MTTLPQYLRRLELNVGGHVIQETLRVVFSVRMGGDASTQPSTVRVYNLAETTAAAITIREARVSLQAGYADAPLGLVYSGTVRRGDTEQHGLDRISTIALGNRDAELSTLFSRSYQQVSLFQIVRDIVHTMGLTVHVSGTAVPSETLPEWSFSGRCRDALDALLAPRGVRWYPVGGNVLFGTNNGTPFAGDFLLSQASGLIGSPARTEDGGMKAKMVLNPEIELGQRIFLESRQLEGIYIVKTVLHQGDTWGGDWATEIEAVAR